MRAFTAYVKPLLEYRSCLSKPNLRQKIDLLDGVQRYSLPCIDYLNRLNIAYKQSMKKFRFVTVSIDY